MRPTRRYGEIHLYIGPMFGEKTTELQRAINRHKRAKKSTIILKYCKDDQRYGPNSVTHDGNIMEAVSVSQLLPHLEMVKAFSVVGVDEAQFFNDLIPFSMELVTRGKLVIITALDGNFLKEPYYNVLDLIPKCKKVKKLLAVCKLCGEDAAFTRRLSEQMEAEIIGGSELYNANCENCYAMSLSDYNAEIAKRRSEIDEEENIQ